MSTSIKNRPQTLGNAIKFQVEFMMMMLHADRTEQAASAYDRIIKLCDQCGDLVKDEDRQYTDSMTALPHWEGVTCNLA